MRKDPTFTVNQETAMRRPAGQALSKPPAFRRMLPSLVVIVVYLLLGIAAFWPEYPEISKRLFGIDSDFAQSVWFVGWVRHSLAHGLNPFFSKAMLVPTGVNLTQSTASPLLGLITAPFAPVLRPVVGANLLMVLSMPISATAAYAVLRKWNVWGPAAAIGGLMYGFSPYMVGQGLGHVSLVFVPLPPFIALTIASIVQGAGSSRRLGIQLGLLLVAQYLISPEVLAIVGVFTVAALACVAIGRRHQALVMVHRLWRPVGIALAVAAVLLAYPVWMMLAGPQHFTGSLPTTNGYHNDLLNFLVPGPEQRNSLGMRSLGIHLDSRTNPTEAGGYIGAPLIVIAGFFVWRSRSRPRTQLTAVLLVVAALLSLGPYLSIDGHLSHIPLPFWLLDHFPLLVNIVPSRVSFVVDACLAVLIAFGIDDLRRATVRRGPYRLDRQWRGIAIIGVILAAVVVTQLPQWPYSAPTASAFPAPLRQAIPAGDPVAITYPYATIFHMQPMLWQAENGFDFRLLGGYAYHPAPNGGPTGLPSVMKPPGLQQFLADQNVGISGGPFGPAPAVSPDLVATTRTSLSNYDVRLVIVDRSIAGSGPVMELFTDALGPPALSADGFSVWSDWHGEPSHEQFLPHIVTSVTRPANDARLSGATLLDAKATAWVRVTKVAFLLTGGSLPATTISEGSATLYGWLAKWNTANVPNGTYSLQSIAYDASGASRASTRVQITIKN